MLSTNGLGQKYLCIAYTCIIIHVDACFTISLGSICFLRCLKNREKCGINYCDFKKNQNLN